MNKHAATLIDSGIVDDSGLTLAELSALTPVDPTGIVLGYNPTTKKVVRSVGIPAIADKIYSFSPLVGVQSIPYAFLSTGPNTLGELGTTYWTGAINFPNIPAPSQTPPTGYKRVCDIYVSHTNYNSSNKTIKLNNYYIVNAVGVSAGGETRPADVAGMQKPKIFAGSMVGIDIQQAAPTTVQFIQFYTIEQSLAPINMVNPDLRIDVKYCIRLALI